MVSEVGGWCGVLNVDFVGLEIFVWDGVYFVFMFNMEVCCGGGWGICFVIVVVEVLGVGNNSVVFSIVSFVGIVVVFDFFFGKFEWVIIG